MGAFPGDLEIGKAVMQTSEIVCGGGFRFFIGIAEDELSDKVSCRIECAGTLTAISHSPFVEAQDAAGGPYGRISWRALPRKTASTCTCCQLVVGCINSTNDILDPYFVLI